MAFVNQSFGFMNSYHWTHPDCGHKIPLIDHPDRGLYVRESLLDVLRLPEPPERGDPSSTYCHPANRNWGKRPNLDDIGKSRSIECHDDVRYRYGGLLLQKNPLRQPLTLMHPDLNNGRNLDPHEAWAMTRSYEEIMPELVVSSLDLGWAAEDSPCPRCVRQRAEDEVERLKSEIQSEELDADGQRDVFEALSKATTRLRSIIFPTVCYREGRQPGQKVEERSFRKYIHKPGSSLIEFGSAVGITRGHPDDFLNSSSNTHVGLNTSFHVMDGKNFDNEEGDTDDGTEEDQDTETTSSAPLQKVGNSRGSSGDLLDRQNSTSSTIQERKWDTDERIFPSQKPGIDHTSPDLAGQVSLNPQLVPSRPAALLDKYFAGGATPIVDNYLEIAASRYGRPTVGSGHALISTDIQNQSQPRYGPGPQLDISLFRHIPGMTDLPPVANNPAFQVLCSSSRAASGSSSLNTTPAKSKRASEIMLTEGVTHKPIPTAPAAMRLGTSAPHLLRQQNRSFPARALAAKNGDAVPTDRRAGGGPTSAPSNGAVVRRLKPLTFRKDGKDIWSKAYNSPDSGSASGGSGGGVPIWL